MSLACGDLSPSMTTVFLGGRDAHDRVLGGLDLLEAYGVSDDMVLVPSGAMTETQRRAIGALCHDAGVAAHMAYSASGSGATM